MAQIKGWQHGRGVCIFSVMLRMIFTTCVLLAHLVVYTQSFDHPDGRTSAMLLYNKKERSMLLFDGYQIHLDSTQNDVWKWDGKSWNRIIAYGPGSRSLSAGAYDSVNERVTVFGGLGKGNYSNKKSDAWTFYRSGWEKVEINSIGSRDHHEMVYAEHLKAFVLYGGLDSTRNYDTTTWLLKSNRFVPLKISGPGVRYHFAMSYDPLRNKVVLYGGGKEHQRNELWEFDGVQWTKVQFISVSPGPKISHSMAFHDQMKMTLLHGGDESGITWGWDGTRWMRIADNGPIGGLIAFGYDPERNVMIAFGGSGPENSLFSETWELHQATWKKISDNGRWKWVDGMFRKIEQ